MKKRTGLMGFLPLMVLVVCLSLPGSVSADLTDGLIAYWPFDEGSGPTAADVAPSGNGFDGTLQNDPLWVPGVPNVSGKFGTALDFDGLDDFVLVTERSGSGPGVYPAELMPDTFTVSCWVNLNQFIYFSGFVGNGNDNSDDESGFYFVNFGWVDENDSDFVQCIRTESGMYYLETENIYQTNTWYHIATTYDGQYARIYVNGKLVPVNQEQDDGGPYQAVPVDVGGPMRWISATSGNYPDRFTIGKWQDPGYDLLVNGTIDDVGYWSRALNAAEIAEMWNQGDGSPIIDNTIARNPDPFNGETLVDPSVILEWDPPLGITPDRYKVYLGTDPNVILYHYSGTETNTNFNPEPDLLNDTQYYWRVDTEKDPNTFVGRIWTFRTIPKVPVILTHPENQIVDPNGTAVFTVTALNATGSNGTPPYQWFGPSGMLSDSDPDITGATTASVSIANAELADEGSYYCKVTNEGGSVDSDSAMLIIKQLVGYWPMNGNTNDASGHARHGQMKGQAQWIAGIDGQALYLGQDHPTDPNLHDYVVVDDNPNFLSWLDFSVSIWVQTTELANQSGIIGNKNWYSGGNTGWLIHDDYASGDWGWNYSGAIGGRVDYSSSNTIIDGQWHMLTVTHDRDGVAKFYYDGDLESQANISGSTGTIDTAYPMCIGTDGAEGSEWPAWFIGAVDEARIYNYVLTATEVADLYLNHKGGWLCADPEALPYDFTGPDGMPDCKVDLFDYASFASTWLDCERYPDCVDNME